MTSTSVHAAACPDVPSSMSNTDLCISAGLTCCLPPAAGIIAAVAVVAIIAAALLYARKAAADSGKLGSEQGRVAGMCCSCLPGHQGSSSGQDTAVENLGKSAAATAGAPYTSSRHDTAVALFSGPTGMQQPSGPPPAMTFMRVGEASGPPPHLEQPAGPAGQQQRELPAPQGIVRAGEHAVVWATPGGGAGAH